MENHTLQLVAWRKAAAPQTVTSITQILSFLEVYFMMIGGISGSCNPYSYSAGFNSSRSQADGADKDQKVKGGYKTSPEECQTCKERKYQDGSNESDVSFKAPGHISPEASASAVMAHEQQHVSNAYQKAAENGGEVVSCSVSLRTAVCPECGTVYVSGGKTNTAISYTDETNPYQKDKKAQDAIRYTGANIDYAA